MPTQRRITICTSGLDIKLSNAKFFNYVARRVESLDIWMYRSINIWPNRFNEICKYMYGTRSISISTNAKFGYTSVFARGSTNSALITTLIHYVLTGGSSELFREFVRVRYGDIIDPDVGLTPGYARLFRTITFSAWRPVNDSITWIVRDGAAYIVEHIDKPELHVRLYKSILVFEDRASTFTVALRSRDRDILLEYLSKSPLTRSSAIKLAFYVGLCIKHGVEEVCKVLRESGVSI